MEDRLAEDTTFPHSDSETEEESLSLCDLPITTEKPHHNHIPSKQDNARKSSDHDFFEFFSNRNPALLRPAEDIISSGKLLPYKSLPTNSKLFVNEYFDELKPKSFVLRRSDSVNDLRNSQARLTRSNRSLDYSKLQRASSSSVMRERRASFSSPIPHLLSERIPSRNREFSYRREPVSSSPVKPRWHLLLFGLIKAPPEMELKDIRNRQSRRVPSSMFPSYDGLQTVSVKRDGGKGSWRLFRALSCKDHADVVVTASLGCIPHV